MFEVIAWLFTCWGSIGFIYVLADSTTDIYSKWMILKLGPVIWVLSAVLLLAVKCVLKRD